MNASEHCGGGGGGGCSLAYTSIANYIEKSVLGYVFISSDLEEFFTSMQIGEEKRFTP